MLIVSGVITIIGSVWMLLRYKKRGNQPMVFLYGVTLLFALLGIALVMALPLLGLAR